MPRRPTPRPTDTELAILRVLWHRGPSTVREVHAELAGQEGVGYTTVLKMLQIMADKGLVERDTSARAHVYRAAESEGETQRDLIGDLLDRAFDGSAGRLVMQALATRPATAAELTEIRRLLDTLEPPSGTSESGDDDV